MWIPISVRHAERVFSPGSAQDRNNHVSHHLSLLCLLPYIHPFHEKVNLQLLAGDLAWKCLFGEY